MVFASDLFCTELASGVPEAPVEGTYQGTDLPRSPGERWFDHLRLRFRDVSQTSVSLWFTR
jgi:hypothetical protein